MVPVTTVIGILFVVVANCSHGHVLSMEHYDQKHIVEFENAETTKTTSSQQLEEPNCTLELSNNSIKYWKSMIGIYEPNFIHFTLKIDGTNMSAVKEAFMPDHWVWTYQTQQGLYPYLNWNMDFNLTSFGLLDAKTLHQPDTPYVKLFATSTCNLTFGELNTTRLIAEQLLQLVIHLTDGNPISAYDESYWCFLAEVPGFRDTMAYKFGQYLLYPISAVNYNCCLTYFRYVENKYEVDCPDHQMDKLSQCTVVPYILGILIFLYFPLPLLNMSGLRCADITDDTDNEHANQDELTERDDPTVSTSYSILSNNESHFDVSNDWLFLDGSHPKTITGVFKKSLWFMANYPILTSRLKRLICLLLLPIVVYIKISVYYKYQPYVTKKLVEVGVPMGMLSILGDEKDYVRVFVPIFHGAVTILVMYHVFGILFLVLPSSLKHVVKLGVPRRRLPDSEMISPLCFTPSEIRKISLMPVTEVDGSMTAAEYILGGIYMLFTGSFWQKSVEMQVNRFRRVYNGDGTLQLICLWGVFFPIYILICGTELIVCLLYYSIPFATFISIMVRGALKVTYLNASHLRRQSCLSVMLSSRLVQIFGTTAIAICFLLFTYSYCLIFIESFTFLAQVFVFCFVAVIVYPQVAFGYLFFCVVLVYYIFRLFHSFGHAYLELLSEAVEVSVNKEGFQNYVTYFNGKLIVTNVTNPNIRGLCINDIDIPISENAFHAVTNQITNSEKERKVIYRNCTYGIRRDLFDHIVQEFCPVHLQVLAIMFQLALILFLLLFLGSLTTSMFTGPSSDISDVMHVIFIITIGALPRVLEVAMSNSGEHVKRDIKLRRLEQSISGYWENRQKA